MTSTTAAFGQFTGLRGARQGAASKGASAAAARPSQRASRLAVRAAVARETDPKKRIVITGMGIASVHGNDPDVFYDALLAGKSGISMIERFDASEYPTRFAGQIKNFECAPRRLRSGGLGLGRRALSGARVCGSSWHCTALHRAVPVLR